jgi:hypothetical protein
VEKTIHSGRTLWGKTKVTLQMINWDHSIFALPFALTGVLVAAHGIPPLPTVGWILGGDGFGALGGLGLHSPGGPQAGCAQSPDQDAGDSRRVGFRRGL